MVSSLPYPFPPFPFPPVPSLCPNTPLLSPPIEVDPLNPAGGLGSAVSSPKAEVEFGASGGINFIDFTENQLTQIRAV